MEFTKRFVKKFAVKPYMPFERVMVFVDGGYLREHCKKFGGHDNIRWSRLSWVFIRMFNTYGDNAFNANLIRIYYYDAIVPEADPDFEEQKKYFEKIEAGYAYTVKLGTLVKSAKKRRNRQKGVDTLMAIDALTKAYQNHYETGMFLVGDRDFKPLIEAVKDAGKKTIGIFYSRTCPKDLVRSFDMRIHLFEDTFKSLLEDESKA